MTTNMQKTLVVLAVGAMFTASGAAMAVTNLTWDASGTNPTAPTDGSGTWNATAANWSNGTADGVWVNNDAAVIGSDNGTAGTISLGSNQDVSALTVNDGSSGSYYTLSDGLAGGSPVQLNVTTSGPGGGASLNLSGSLTISAGVTLSDETSPWDTILFPNTTTTVDAGATFNAGFYSQIRGTLNVSGTATNTGEWLVSFGGGPGAININQGGVVESFQTRIGTNSSPTTVNVNSGGTLAASYIHSAAGTVNSTTDFLKVDGGTLENGPYTTPGNNVSYSSQAAWITNQVTVQIMAGGATINDSGQFGTQVGTNYNLLVAAPIVSGVTSGTDGGLTVTGGGTVTLANTNTYTGPTTIQSGTLALGTYTYTYPSGGTSVTQTGSIAGSSSVIIDSGGTLDISQSGLAQTVLKSLNDAGGTITFGMNGNQVSNILVNTASSISGTNTINLYGVDGATAFSYGTYNLIADAAGGLTGNFVFGNGTDTAHATLGSNSYLLTLSNSKTAEMLTVSAVPEPAALGLFAIGGMGLVLIGRRRKARA